MKPAAPTVADKWRGRWQGKTVAVIGSGPSLTFEDCERIHRTGWPTIVTNTTFRLCPWATVVLGFDVKWWREHLAEVERTCAGERVTCARVGGDVPVQSFAGVPWMVSFRNSGAVGVALSALGGASRIILLGIDCQKAGGLSHWHGAHPKNLGDAVSMPTWPRHFRNVSRYVGSTPVLNCSRSTALTTFPRVRLEDVLP